MIPRSILRFLVFGLPILVVAFAVLMGAATIADAVQDPVGARTLRWLAMTCLMLLAADGILLVGILGLISLGDDRQPPTE